MLCWVMLAMPFTGWAAQDGLTPRLVFDAPDLSPVDLPQFRRMTDPPLEDGGREATKTGLERLRASGSGQFNADQLRELIRQIAHPGPVIFDLRAEPHGFVNDLAVSWFTPRLGLATSSGAADLQKREAALLRALRPGAVARVTRVGDLSRRGAILRATDADVRVVAARTEQQVVRAAGFGYERFAVADAAGPTVADLERLVRLYRDRPARSWWHFHGASGEGATTAFLAAVDMLANAREVPFEAILQRQALRGPDDLASLPPKDNWKHAPAAARLALLKSFHAYCRDQAAGGFAVPFGAWRAAGGAEVKN